MKNSINGKGNASKVPHRSEEEIEPHFSLIGTRFRLKRGGILSVDDKGPKTRFEKLVERYRQAMLSSIKIFETAIIENQIEVIRGEAHRLKGSGKSYGFPEITNQAGALEKTCCDRTDLSDAVVAGTQSLISILKINSATANQ